MALVTQAGYGICSETFRCGAGPKESFINRSSLPWRSLKQSSFVGIVKFESKRRNQMVVAASPPTDDAVIAAEPLTKEDLIAYLASGCKPKEKWRSVFSLGVSIGSVAFILLVIELITTFMGTSLIHTSPRDVYFR